MSDNKSKKQFITPNGRQYDDRRYVYQVIFQDEYNNLCSLGFFNDLDDCIDSVNDQLSSYGDGKYKFKKGDIVKRPGTLGYCFDMDIAEFFAEEKESEEEKNKVYDDLYGGLMVRGFVFDRKSLKKELKDLDEVKYGTRIK